ncbi:MAG: GAF domain-containing protein [Caldilineaceae bacterium]
MPEQQISSLAHDDQFSFINALQNATTAIRLLDRENALDIEAILVSVLPHLTAAFQAHCSFVVQPADHSSNLEPAIPAVKFYPEDQLRTALPEQNALLQHVIDQEQAERVAAPAHEPTAVIPALAFCHATAALLVPVRIVDHLYLVGICRTQRSAGQPFTRADLIMLEHLLMMLAIGSRAGESRRRELESIEHISRIAITGTAAEVAESIAFQAVTVTDSLYAAIWTVNKHSAQVEFLTVHHAYSADWQPHQRVLDLGETSFIGFAALHGKQIYVRDVDDQTGPDVERYLRWDAETKSALCIPLRLNKQILGVLYVASDRVGGIRREQQRFLEQLAPHAAIALHNSRLSEIRQRVIRFQKDISDVLPLDEQLSQILDHLEQQVDLNGLFLAMYNAANGEVTFPLVFERGVAILEDQKVPGSIYGPQKPGQQGMGFVEWVLQHRTTLLVDNFATWPQRNSIDRPHRQGVKSCLVVPLMRQERIVGAIGLRSYFESRGNFDEYDRRFMEGLADHVAIILSNSQHYDMTQLALEETNRQLQERLRELRAVSEFQRRISDIDEEDQEIQNIYLEARSAMAGVGLDVSNMYIALYEERDHTISFPLAYEQGRLVEETIKVKQALYSRTNFGEHRSVAEWIMERWRTEGIRSALLIPADFRQWVQDHGIRPFATKTKCWLGAPMIYKDKLLGMIGLRDHEHEYAFHENHKELLETIANQAAIAIENARLYDSERRDARQFRALHEAGKAITRAGLDLDDVLQAILEQAVAVTDSFFGTLQLADEDYLEFKAAWPKAQQVTLQQQFGRMPLAGKGITARAVRLNDAQLVPNVHLDEDFIDATGQTGSAIAVVLRHGNDRQGKPMGVLNIEHHEVNGLTTRDRSVLIGLANLAIVAVENAQNAEQFSRTNTVAIMGAWGADIVHDIHREVGVIRLTIDTLRHETAIPPAVLQQRLDEIDEYVQNLVMPPLPGDLPADDGTHVVRETVPIDLVVQAEVAAMQRRHGRVYFTIDLAAPAVEAQIHEQWLRRLLRHLVINSVNANKGKADLSITVGTVLHPDLVEVWVADNGRGIRPEIVPMLFHRPIPHSGVRSDERHGRGLLLVRYIVEQHGGKTWLKSNQVQGGSCIAFTVPRA